MGKLIINIRGIDCKPEFKEQFNKWYNEVHVPMLLKGGTIRKASRYKRIGDDEQYPEFLAIYEFDDASDFRKYEASLSTAEAIDDFKKTWGTPDKGCESKWRVQYELVRIWEK